NQECPFRRRKPLQYQSCGTRSYLAAEHAASGVCRGNCTASSAEWKLTGKGRGKNEKYERKMHRNHSALGRGKEESMDASGLHGSNFGAGRGSRRTAFNKPKGSAGADRRKPERSAASGRTGCGPGTVRAEAAGADWRDLQGAG